MRALAQKIIMVLSLAGFLALLPLAAEAGTTPAPANAKVFFANLKDGQTVKSPFSVQFGESNVAIEPAGAVKPNSGHYHLLIDTTLSPDEFNRPIANDAQHLHFGKAQTEATVTLPPGQHTLQIVLGDGAHVPHNPPIMSPVITVSVQ